MIDDLLYQFRAIASGPAAVTIGVFDGVHRGHRVLLDRLTDIASRDGLVPVALTFTPHPQHVLRHGDPVPSLSALEDRLALLRDAGVAVAYPLPFTHGLANTPAADFVTALVEGLQMRHLVVGPDFALGKGREGTVAYLGAAGADRGFDVTTVEPQGEAGIRFSSTAIRRALAEGDVREANRQLGREYRLAGEVVQGNQLGRTLGFPTANVALDPDLLVPANGVYVCRAHLGGQDLPAVASIGVRPTIASDQPRWVEVFLLDFEGDLYGRELGVSFLDRLRPEERFASVDALVDQMHRDVAAARAVLAAA